MTRGKGKLHQLSIVLQKKSLILLREVRSKINEKFKEFHYSMSSLYLIAIGMNLLVLKKSYFVFQSL